MTSTTWRLDEGPEFAKSRQKVEPVLKRFEENFKAVRWVLERDPFAFSDQFLPEDNTKRVFVTRDFMEGFELVVFFTVYRANRSCELHWVELNPLTPNQQLWGTELG